MVADNVGTAIVLDQAHGVTKLCEKEIQRKEVSDFNDGQKRRAELLAPQGGIGAVVVVVGIRVIRAADIEVQRATKKKR